MPRMPTTIDLTTEDGVCPAHVFHPPGGGPWPAVLFEAERHWQTLLALLDGALRR